MNAIGATLTILACAAVMGLSRQKAALAFIAATLYITQGQQVNLGLNIMAIRFVELAAFFRVVVRGELFKISFNTVDRWMIVASCTMALVFCFREGTIDAYQIGLAVDANLAYFAFRTFIADNDDFTFLMKGTAALLVPIALLTMVEANTGRNLFSVMGGVPAESVFREGHYRANAAFRISITAGSLGGTYAPLFVGFFFLKSYRKWAMIGVISSITILLASHSSGPLMALMAGVASWACWKYRRRMRTVRWGIVASLFALHLTMNKPVWWIFDRLSDYIGGDGWHRSNLIDKWLRDFSIWAFDGMDFLRTADWAATQMPWGGVDVTNYFISTALNGGLISFIFLIVFLTKVFSKTGQAAALLRNDGPEFTLDEALIWSAGSAVCAHVVNQTAVVYWDQFYVIWYAHLAIAISLSVHAIKSHAARSTNLYIADDQAVEITEPETSAEVPRDSTFLPKKSSI